MIIGMVSLPQNFQSSGDDAGRYVYSCFDRHDECFGCKYCEEVVAIRGDIGWIAAGNISNTIYLLLQ